MAGISHVLSVAKEALLTHQLSLQVASHNIANVDTAGYTRQSLQLETHNATPISSGMLGGGVKGTNILRNYDQFMVQRLASQTRESAQQERIREVIRQLPPPKPVPVEAPNAVAPPSVGPPEERAARQMVSHMEQLLTDHPKLTPFAKALAATAMEKAARQTEQPLPDTAKALGDLKTSFLDQLHQWFLPPNPPTAATPLTPLTPA